MAIAPFLYRPPVFEELDGVSLRKSSPFYLKRNFGGNGFLSSGFSRRGFSFRQNSFSNPVTRGPKKYLFEDKVISEAEKYAIEEERYSDFQKKSRIYNVYSFSGRTPYQAYKIDGRLVEIDFLLDPE